MNISKQSFLYLALIYLWVSHLYAIEDASIITNTDKLQLRGLANFNGNSYASLHDSVSGVSFWLSKGATRQNVELIDVNFTDKLATVLVQNQELKISLIKNTSNFGSKILFEINSKAKEVLDLTPYNALMYEKHKELAALTMNPRNGENVRDQRVQLVIESFILENPSHEEWGQFIDGMKDYIDMDTLLGIRFTGVESRNATNTPGWGNKRSIDYGALRQALSNNATIEQINEIVKKKGFSI